MNFLVDVDLLAARLQLRKAYGAAQTHKRKWSHNTTKTKAMCSQYSVLVETRNHYSVISLYMARASHHDCQQWIQTVYYIGV